MSGRSPIGNVNLVSAVVLASVLLIITYLFFPVPKIEGDAGICFPSPNQWNLSKLGGWLINSTLILLCGFIVSVSNRKYNFISLAEPLVPALLLVMLASNCLAGFTLTTSTLLLTANLVCLYFLFETFESYNATHQFFSIATFISVGSMFQYAFLMMIPVFLLGGLFMKSLRFKELIAFGFGLVAPYWIVIGVGIVPPTALEMPSALHTIGSAVINREIFVTILTIGITALFALIISLYNGLTLMSRNSRMRGMYLTFNLMGIVSLGCMLIDFNNFISYSSTLYLWFALQTGGLFALNHVRRINMWLLILSVFYTVSFAFTL